MVKITFEQVGLRFGEKEIFRGLGCEIAAGRVTAVTGHNGSGKSTFLRLAARLLLPDAGRVAVTADGVPLEKAELRRRLAMVTPELRLYGRLTARENLRFLLGLRGVALSEEHFLALMERTGLAAAPRDAFVGTFSTGMRQRLKLAALIGCGADIWLLDEPGANLDAAGSAMVMREARQAAAAGRLVLWATNDPREEAAADDAIELAGH